MEQGHEQSTSGVWTIVVAAGAGSRFGGDVPKQFSAVGGRRVLDWSIGSASAASEGTVIVLPAHGSYSVAELTSSVQAFAAPSSSVYAVSGGATRSESVRAGLAAVPASATTILVHDAARPLADTALFQRVIRAVAAGAKAVVPVVDVVDTVRDTDGNPIDRDTLQIVQTPQGFAAAALRSVHSSQDQATDDASLVAQAGGDVATVPGDRWNIKVTTPDDAIVVAALLRERAANEHADENERAR